MGDSYRYFVARRTDSGIRTRGDRHCELGYRIPAERDGGFQGVFAGWTWDGEQLTARNDYSGYYPVFYYADSDQVMISDSLVKLVALGASTEYDEQALAVFCRCGFFLGESTPFRRIRVLPPNAAFSWHGGRLSVQGQSRLTAPQPVSAEQAVDGYIELFRKAMDRYPSATDGFTVPLTGGRDSRQILLELHRRGMRPSECVTCGEARDIRVAGQLTERLGLSHRLLAPTCRWTEYGWRKNIATHLCTLEHTWIMLLGDYLGANYSDVYEGTGVGILTRSELLRADLLKLCQAGHLDLITKWLFDTVGPGREFFRLLPERFEFLSHSEDVAASAVIDELGHHAATANPLTAFNFWNWNRRATALLPFGVERSVARLRTPFMDRDLYDFVSSLPPELTLAAEPQTCAIRKAFPEFADIPFYDALPKETPTRNSRLTQCRNLTDRLLLMGRCSPAHLRTFWRMRRPKGDHLTARNRAMQDSVLMYLVQLDHCSDKGRAEKVLAGYEQVK